MIAWLRSLCKDRGVGSVGQVLEPSGGVDHVHRRSESRGTLVSMPLSDPRAALVGRTGTSSIRPRYSMAWSFSPGLMPSASRIFEGMTIWYFDDTVMVLIRISDRSRFSKAKCKFTMPCFAGSPERTDLPGKAIPADCGGSRRDTCSGTWVRYQDVKCGVGGLFPVHGQGTRISERG